MCTTHFIELTLMPMNLQWHNSWGQSTPLTLLTGKFLLTYQEKRGKEKGENRKVKEKLKSKKGKVEN